MRLQTSTFVFQVT